jgi:hypothetical protein
MHLRRACSTLPWLLVLLLLPAFPAVAQDDEDDELLIEDEEPADVDNLKIYRAFKEELTGLSPEEELDAWYRYIDHYPNTPYGSEIKRRIKELESAMLDEAEADAPSWEEDGGPGGRGARYEEMGFIEPFLFLTNNPRKKVHLQIAYGYQSTFNYDFGLEWAFARNFSVFGHIRHFGHGLGIALVAGPKVALIKDTRTGGLMVAGLAVKGGADPGALFGVDPFFGIGLAKLGVPVTLQFQVGLDMRFTPWHWDLHAGLHLGFKPSDRFNIFLETTGRNTLRRMLTYDAPSGEQCGDEGAQDEHCTTEYFGFYEASVGVKFYPKETIEITIALRAPYFYRKWQHYSPLGGGASVMIYF